MGRTYPVLHRYVTCNPQSFPNFFQLGFLRRDLLGVCTTDEDGNQAYDFKDGLGRTILAGHIDGSEPISLIMNMTVAMIWWVFTHLPFLTPNRENLKEFLIGKSSYSYRYDFLHRYIYKKLPERDAIYYIYDRGSHQVFS